MYLHRFGENESHEKKKKERKKKKTCRMKEQDTEHLVRLVGIRRDGPVHHSVKSRVDYALYLP